MKQTATLSNEPGAVHTHTGTSRAVFHDDAPAATVRD
jgi:hypothetical protein